MSNSKDKGKAVANALEPEDSNDLSIPEDRRLFPRLRSDPPPQPEPHSLEEFRKTEGRENRKHRLHQLWKSLPDVLHAPQNGLTKHGDPGQLSPGEAEKLQAMYDSELVVLVTAPASGSQAPHIGWKEFKEFAYKKEAGMLVFYSFNAQWVTSYLALHLQSYGKSFTTNSTWTEMVIWINLSYTLP